MNAPCTRSICRLLKSPSNRVAEVEAGLSLEMPGSGDYNRNKILEAVRAGRLSAEKLDEAVVPLLAVMLRAKDQHRPGVTFDAGRHDALADGPPAKAWCC
jgi:beta-glucosidase